MIVKLWSYVSVILIQQHIIIKTHMNSFHYLFKYIVIGDTCKYLLTQLLASHPSSSSSWITSLKTTMTPLLESNLGLKQLKLEQKQSNYKYGTQLDNKISDLSPDLTIEVPLEHSLFTILRGNKIKIKERHLQSCEELAQRSEN